MSARHVVLVTYGEPPTPAFADHLRYSWKILRRLTRLVAPIPALAVPLIALSRARFRNRLWRAEAYSSPLEAITCAQAAALEHALAALEPGTLWKVHVAYEFRTPALEAVLAGIPTGEPTDVLPLYAADSAFTHGIARAVLEARGGNARVALETRGGNARVVPALDPAVLAELSSRHVLAGLARRGIVPGPEWALLLAAHGTLLKPPRPMETGREATERIFVGMAHRLSPHFGRVQIGWLNHVFGGPWTSPAADRALAELADAGFRKLVYYPFGFLADNAETELEGRILYRAHPGLGVVHLPCLNASPDLAAALASAVTAPPDTTTQPDFPLRGEPSTPPEPVLPPVPA